MAEAERRVRIFISSPTDVTVERERAEAVIAALSAELQAKGEIALEAIRWEDAWFTAAEHFQSQIPKPSDCDLVVCLFWKRLGTELPESFARADGSLRTGTEWEFEEALEGAKARPEKVPDIFVYRKTAEITFAEKSVDLERAQKRALDAFWDKWFRSEDGHFLAAFTPFETTDDFASVLRRHLERWLADRRGRGRWSLNLQGSPFRGLAAFDEDHAAVFYGRRRQVEQARARLISAAEAAGGLPFLLILGMSGAGKSSLLRAGLVPRLLAPEATPSVARWRRLVVTPSSLRAEPLDGLARALLAPEVLPELAAGDFVGAEALALLFRSAPETAPRPLLKALDRWAVRLAAAAGNGAPPLTGLLLGLDQFEEFFAWPEAAQRAFLALLGALLRSRRVWVAATLRSDFYPLLQRDPMLLALKEAGRSLDLAPPGEGQLAEIIEAPAAAAGLTYESDPATNESLADKLLAEAQGANALPLLQFALHELYETRERDSNLLRLAAYAAMGGLPGAIERRAEAALRALPREEQQALPEVVRALADPAEEAGEGHPDVARRVPLAAFAEGSVPRRLVEALVAARLVTASGAGAELRVAHEAIFTHWARAQAILDASRDDRRLRRLVEREARLWAEGGRRPVDLLRGGRLLQARELQARQPAELVAAADYLDVSAAAAERETRRRRNSVLAVIVGLSLLLLLAVGASFYAFDQEAEAQRQASIAEERALSLEKQNKEIAELGGRLNKALAALVQSIQTNHDNHILSATVIAKSLNSINDLTVLTLTRNLSESAIEDYIAESIKEIDEIYQEYHVYELEYGPNSMISLRYYRAMQELNFAKLYIFVGDSDKAREHYTEFIKLCDSLLETLVEPCSW